MGLREIRTSKGLTQVEAATILGISRRTYINYEKDEDKLSKIKFNNLYKGLEQHDYIDEEHGVLKLEDIKRICTSIFEKEDVEYCYLFGSYARGEAHNKSDVDLLIYTTSITGIDYFGLIEELRENLKKKVDLINFATLKGGNKLINEVLRDGVKIYEKSEG